MGINRMGGISGFVRVVSCGEIVLDCAVEGYPSFRWLFT